MPITEQRRRELAEMSDEDIDYSDIPELDEEWFKKAKLVYPEERNKRQVTIRVDNDVINWFKAQGRGYQTRMNAVLRAYYEAAKAKENH